MIIYRNFYFYLVDLQVKILEGQIFITVNFWPILCLQLFFQSTFISHKSSMICLIADKIAFLMISVAIFVFFIPYFVTFFGLESVIFVKQN